MPCDSSEAAQWQQFNRECISDLRVELISRPAPLVGYFERKGSTTRDRYPTSDYRLTILPLVIRRQESSVEQIEVDTRVVPYPSA